MPWILRTSNDVNNPTLAGGVYGKWITAGRGVYYSFDGTQTRGILFISDGGKYGLDHLDGFEYKGLALAEFTEWIFHRGSLTKQISPLAVTGVDASTDVLTMASVPYSNGDLVRVANRDGTLAAGLSESLRYQVSDKTGTTLKLKDEAGVGYIDITSTGSGTTMIWKADSGFDDPEQGLPTFCPEVATTFNNIAYVEFKLPTNRSTATDPPDWGDFRAFGTGRRLMDYDESGIEQGVVVGDDALLSNVALEIADNMVNGLKCNFPRRMHWSSWKALRDSAKVDIWQRVVPNDNNDPAISTGFTANYYRDQTWTSLVLTRIDPTINLSGDMSTSPAPGVDGTNFSVRWTGRITPLYTERYTFTFPSIDDQATMWIGGQQVVSGSYPTSPTGQIDLVAGQAYDIQVDFRQSSGGMVNPYFCQLAWQSASQAFQVIPASSVSAHSVKVKRYESHMAFALPTEASEVHERMMDRVPGWHWTDRNGRVEFLAPDRPIAYTFQIDRIDDDVKDSIVKNTFVKKRIALGDRRNFVLYRYRDRTQTGFPFQYVQAEREALRAFTNGEPTNDPYTDLGVTTRSLAERMAEEEMIFKTDPDHTADLSGGRKASKLRKNELVKVSYYDHDDNFVADASYMIIFHAWGASNDKQDFQLVPIVDPFYTDEVASTQQTVQGYVHTSGGAAVSGARVTATRAEDGFIWTGFTNFSGTYIMVMQNDGGTVTLKATARHQVYATTTTLHFPADADPDPIVVNFTAS